MRTVRKELHERWAQDNNFKSFFVSAKTGDKVQTMFVKFASYLAQVSLSKDDIEASGVRIFLNFFIHNFRKL